MSVPLRLAAACGRPQFTAHAEALAYGLFKILPEARELTPRPLNMVVLVDRSAATQAERRFEWMQRALGLLVERLGPEAIFGLVAYADHAKVVLAAEPFTDAAKARRVVSFLDSQSLGSGSSLLEGLKAAAEEARRHASAGRLNRIVVLTASHTRQEAEVERLARTLSAEGLGVTILGVGTDWDTALAIRVADAVFGSVRLAPRPTDLPAVLTAEMASLERLPFASAQLRLRLARGVSVRRVFRVFPAIAHWLPLRPTERDVWVSLGDLSAAEPCYVLAELVVSPRAEGPFRLASAEVAYELPPPRPAAGRSEPAELVATVTAENGPVNREVMRYVEEVQLYSLVERGIEARRGGDAPGAGRLLANALRIANDAGHGAIAEALAEAVATLTGTGTLPEVMTKRLSFMARQPEE